MHLIYLCKRHSLVIEKRRSKIKEWLGMSGTTAKYPHSQDNIAGGNGPPIMRVEIPGGREKTGCKISIWHTEKEKQ